MNPIILFGAGLIVVRILASVRGGSSASKQPAKGPRTPSPDGGASPVPDTGAPPFPVREVYPPRSPEAIALFSEAARVAGLPVEWARSEGLHEIIDAESDGWVGRPNYTYNGVRGRGFNQPSRRDEWPEVWTEIQSGVHATSSTATGIGQMIVGNVERFYPDGLDGIADPLNEAVGMLRYIQHRYDTPDKAWEFYNLPRCAPGTPRYYDRRAFGVGCKPGEGY